jgi:hypothetical protein
MGRRTGVVALAVAGLLALSAAAGCGGSSGSSGSAGGGSAPAAIDGVANGASRKASGELTAAQGDFALLPKHGPADPGSVGPKVIKTATLRIDVDRGKFGDAIGKGTDIADRAGGYVVSTQIGGTGERFGQLVIRVPAARFVGVLHKLTSQLGDVTAQRVSGRDVTADFIDLQARKRNLAAQERVLLRLMDRAATVSDTIRVQNELSRVQGQIEEIKGQLRYLGNQAQLSTITVTLQQAGAAHAMPGKRSAISQAVHDAGSRALGVVTAVIAGAGFVIPTALLLAVAALIGWRLWARFGAPRPRVVEADPS